MFLTKTLVKQHFFPTKTTITNISTLFKIIFFFLYTFVDLACLMSYIIVYCLTLIFSLGHGYFFSQKIVYLFYPNAVYQISISYYAWKMSKSLWWVGVVGRPGNNSWQMPKYILIRYGTYTHYIDLINKILQKLSVHLQKILANLQNFLLNLQKYQRISAEI